jgi:hypothetical protein
MITRDSFKRYRRHLLLGYGFQSHLDNFCSNFAVTPVSDPQRAIEFSEKLEAKKDIPSENIRLQIVSQVMTAEEVIKASTSGELTVQTQQLPIPAAIGAGLKASVEKSSENTYEYAVYWITKTTRTDSLSSAELTLDAQRRLNENQRVLFYNEYGDQYVSGLTYGKKIVIALKMDKGNAEKFKSYAGTLNIDVPYTKFQGLFNRTDRRSNTVTFTEKYIDSLGDNTPWEFSTLKELNEQITAHLNVPTESVIDHQSKPYTATHRLLADHHHKLTLMENIARKRTDKILDKIDRLIKKFMTSKITEDNIREKNDGPIRSIDPEYQHYQQLRYQAKKRLKYLEKLQYRIEHLQRLLTYPELTKYRRQLDTFSGWYKNYQYNIERLSSRTLIHKTTIPEGSHSTKYFKLDIENQVKAQAEYLFIKLSNPSHNTLQIKWKNYLFSPEHTAKEKSFPDTGFYIPTSFIDGHFKINVTSQNKALVLENAIEVYAVTHIPTNDKTPVALETMRLHNKPSTQTTRMSENPFAFYRPAHERVTTEEKFQPTRRTVSAPSA